MNFKFMGAKIGPMRSAKANALKNFQRQKRKLC